MSEVCKKGWLINFKFEGMCKIYDLYFGDIHELYFEGEFEDLYETVINKYGLEKSLVFSIVSYEFFINDKKQYKYIM